MLVEPCVLSFTKPFRPLTVWSTLRRPRGCGASWKWKQKGNLQHDCTSADSNLDTCWMVSWHAGCAPILSELHLFSHSHHGAVLLERNLVHESSHEVKSAPVTEKQPSEFGWIGDGLAIKAFSFIPHNNRYFPIHAASACQMNLLLGIFIIAMNHSVGESFEHGNFNFLFSLSGDAKSAHEQLNEPHQLIYEWRNISRTAGELLM